MSCFLPDVALGAATLGGRAIRLPAPFFARPALFAHPCRPCPSLPAHGPAAGVATDGGILRMGRSGSSPAGRARRP
ncbi:MAG: hypothetical protein J0H99_23125, partial [Rhodospirillales bacterium]|nr:hypothetical protein [Rhodospirillales bacterium]